MPEPRKEKPSDRKKPGPENALPCDLEKLKGTSGLSERRRLDRLTYLFESGHLPSEEEIGLWKTDLLKRKPSIIIRARGLMIRSKSSGVIRMTPTAIQTEVLDFLDFCWENKLVANVSILKARQVHMSTLAQLYMACCWIAIGECYCQIVGDMITRTLTMLRIQRWGIRGLPVWLRPKFERESDKGHTVNDDDVGIMGVEVSVATADKGEDVEVGLPSQFRHYTELPRWWQGGEAALAVLAGAEVKTFPAWTIVESTGRSPNDAFGKRFLKAMVPDPERPERKGFFFAWYRLEEYRHPLPKGLTEAEFWGRMGVAEREQFHAHGCDAEQANWYLRSIAEVQDTVTFRREFPFDIHEAFLGTGSGVLDLEEIERQTTLARMWKSGNMEDIPVVSAPAWPCDEMPMDWAPRFARCELRPIPAATPNDPPSAFFGNPSAGSWRVWELPRVGHIYIVAVDVAEGKRVKGADPDSTIIDVLRITYEPDIDVPRLVQVAQLKSESLPPEFAARAAHGVSMIYRAPSKRGGMVLYERNNHGSAFQLVASALRTNLYVHVEEAGATPGGAPEYGIHVRGGSNSNASKSVLVGLLRDSFAGGFLHFNSVETLDQFRTFEQLANGSFGAPQGLHDDCVSASYLAVECARRENRGFQGPRVASNRPNRVAPASGDNLMDDTDPGMVAAWRDHEQRNPKGDRNRRSAGRGI